MHNDVYLYDLSDVRSDRLHTLYSYLYGRPFVCLFWGFTSRSRILQL